jgi:type IV pilus assembly protein PilW
MKHAYARGLTLIELMIAMLLGLIVIAGVISVMISNKNSYRTNEGLAQVQESARTAFELIARDIRQASGNGCNNNNRTANLLSASALWWQDWFGVRGIDSADADTAVAFGTTPGTRVAGTDSIQLQGIEGAGLPVNLHSAAATTIRINAASTTFVPGDIMLVCDMDHATIFQATAYDSSTRTITHGAGGGTPGNCASGLGFPTICDAGIGNVYTFAINSQVSRLTAVDWYIGNNDRPGEGGRSLFRRRLAPGGVEITEEVVAGVTDLEIRYGENGSDVIQDAGVGVDWANVNSVFITLTADSADTNVTTDKTVNTGRIQRTFTYLITLRNRVP